MPNQIDPYECQTPESAMGQQQLKLQGRGLVPGPCLPGVAGFSMFYSCQTELCHTLQLAKLALAMAQCMTCIRRL